MIKKRFFLWVCVFACTIACLPSPHPVHNEPELEPPDTLSVLSELFHSQEEYVSNGFDFPVGPPDAIGYYNAQPFGTNDHLGDDWNGKGGGNSDFGDPVFAIANGYVTSAIDHFGAWSRVVRVIHALPEENGLHFVESLYAHLDTMVVHPGEWVKKGQLLGTIGNSEGLYWAHLHLEIRDSVVMDLGGGYSTTTTGYVDPDKFIRGHRR